MTDELLSLLKEFVAFKSVADSPKQKQECIDWIDKTFFAQDNSQSTKGSYDDSPYLYIPCEASKLLVFAHVDVVPADDAMFTVTVDGDTARGRGVSDMKGAILPFLVAYRDAMKRGESPPVSILITSDEETVGATIPMLLDEGIVEAPVAFTPDSSSTGFVVEHKGIMWSELIAHGKGGHGALPWETDNPVWKLGKALTILQEKFPTGTMSDWQITISPTVLKGSSARNQVADEARCGIDIRYPPSECASADEALTKVSAVLPDDCELKEVLRASPLQTDEQHEMVKRIKSIAEEVVKESIPFMKEHGGTDARYFSERGIPAFLYGPEGGGIHSATEWISLSSLEKHYVMYTQLFREL